MLRLTCVEHLLCDGHHTGGPNRRLLLLFADVGLDLGHHFPWPLPQAPALSRQGRAPVLFPARELSPTLWVLSPEPLHRGGDGVLGRPTASRWSGQGWESSRVASGQLVGLAFDPKPTRGG